MKKLYLAGPEVFLADPASYYEAKKKMCSDHGFEGVSPFDSNTDYNYRPPIEKAFMFSKNNEKLMRISDAIVANITPFRGVSADAGTIFEIGFMRGLNKKIYAYSNTNKDFYARSRIVHGHQGHDWDKNEMKFENFGMVDNLMIHGAIHYADGATFTGNVDLNDSGFYTNLEVFEILLKYLKKEIWAVR